MTKKALKPKAGTRSKTGGARIGKRKRINTATDPYLLKEDYPDASECKKCRSVYHDKRWMHPNNVPVEAEGVPREKVLCPACLKIKDNYAEGFVTLEGEFLSEHKEEILNLIRNKEELAAHINPLERIIEIKDKKGVIEISTTTEKLAERIGQILKKAYHGTVDYKWSSDTKLARVVWMR